MADIEDVATAKVGGVPAWTWALGVVALIVGYAWFKRRSAAATVPTVTANDTSGVSGDGTLAGLSPSLVGAGSGVGLSGTADGTTTQGWLQNALASAEANGTDPLSTLSALNSFLSGGQLTGQQQSIVSQALASQGLPPGYSSSMAAFTTVPTSTVNTSSSPKPNPYAGAASAAVQEIRSFESQATSLNQAANALQAKINASKDTATRQALAAQRNALLAEGKSAMSKAQAESASSQAVRANALHFVG